MALDPQTFPAPRQGRNGPPSPSAGGGGAVPGAPEASVPAVRMWPFIVQARVGTRRSTVVSGSFRGLGLIRSLNFQMYGQELAAIPAVTIIWSTDDSGGVTNSATVTLPSGTPIFDQAAMANPTNNPVGGPAFQTLGGAGARVPFAWPCRYPIMTDTFYLKVSVQVNDAAQDQTVMGFIELMEGLTSAQIADFL